MILVRFGTTTGSFTSSTPTQKAESGSIASWEFWNCPPPQKSLAKHSPTTQPTIEGPKVYKRNGFYYILAPAGGVTNGWQTALRSKNIFGPYEEKIVMAQGSTKINGPHQGALFDDAAGDWHFIHFQDKGIFGRVTHLQRAAWKDDWPVLGTGVDGAEIGEPEEEILAFVATDGDLQINSASRLRLGKLKSQEAISTTASQSSESGLGDSPSEFQFLGNTEGLSREKQKVFPLWENPFVLTRKITEAEFEYSEKFGGNAFGDDAPVPAEGGTTGKFPERGASNSSVHGVIFLGDEYAAIGVDFFKAEIFYLESEKVPCEDKNLEVRMEIIKKMSRLHFRYARHDMVSQRVRDSRGRVSETAVKITSCDFHLTSRNATRESESLSRHPWRRRSEAKAVAPNSPTSPNGEVTPIKLSLHFTATPDNFGLVTFSAEIGGEKWTPGTPPFKTKNAHWVGGRVGRF